MSAFMCGDVGRSLFDRKPEPAKVEPPRTRRVCIREARYDIYCGRPNRQIDSDVPGADGTYGNPYTVKEYGARALDLYVDYMLLRMREDSVFFAEIMSLKGQVLGCWCASKALCHVDYLVLLVECEGILSCEFRRSDGR